LLTASFGEGGFGGLDFGEVLVVHVGEDVEQAFQRLHQIRSSGDQAGVGGGPVLLGIRADVVNLCNRVASTSFWAPNPPRLIGCIFRVNNPRPRRPSGGAHDATAISAAAASSASVMRRL